ncbi:MAG: hypothetical protein ACKOEV_02925, partial [Cytophagales bacterium]
ISLLNRLDADRNGEVSFTEFSVSFGSHSNKFLALHKAVNANNNPADEAQQFQQKQTDLEPIREINQSSLSRMRQQNAN